MKLHELMPAPGSNKGRRRVGRGHGSGRVKTSGKGTKGQNSRTGGGVKLYFEGGQNPWTMKIPHKRGFSRRRFKIVAQVVNLDDLEERFAASETVTPEALEQRGLIRDGSGKRPVKLLGDGELTKAFTIAVHSVSIAARASIEAAGGTITLLGKQPKAEAEPEEQAQPDADAATDPAPTV